MRIPTQMGDNPNSPPCNLNFLSGNSISSLEAHAIIDEGDFTEMSQHVGE